MKEPSKDLEVLPVLEAVRRRPAMYWGDTKTLFTSLVAFISGYEACSRGQGFGQLVPHEFHQFVSEHFGRSSPGGRGWMSDIRENTGSEQEAFDLFFELMDDYRKKSELIDNEIDRPD